MKRQYKFTALSAVLFCLIGLLYGCTRDNEIIIPETSVNPLATDYSVAIGDEVTFTGQNMHLISKVAFDNQVVNITTEPSNRSQTTLIVAVPDNFEVTQHISVVATYNSVHKLTLSDAFEVVVPGVTTDVSSATIGDKITLTGKNMHLITKVNFGDQVVSFDPNPDRSHTSLMVTVPSTFDVTKKVQLSVTYTTNTVNVSNDFEVITGYSYCHHCSGRRSGHRSHYYAGRNQPEYYQETNRKRSILRVYSYRYQPFFQCSRRHYRKFSNRQRSISV